MELTGERPMEGSTPDSLLALHDAGYREVRLRLGPGRVLGFAMPVTYDASFPDGAECDVVPCRTAEGVLAE